MSKVSAFIVGTIGLSLVILIPCAIFFGTIVLRLKEVGLIVSPATTFQLWYYFAILALVVVISVVTVMALIVFGNGEKHVLR